MIGNTKEQTLSVELPVVWKEDGQVVVHFTFEFNDNIIEIHQLEETWPSDRFRYLCELSVLYWCGSVYYC